MSKENYGPWASPINAGMNPQLSSFWKRRLKMLVPASQASLVLSWRNLFLLGALGVLMLGVPTLHSQSTAEVNKASAKVTIDKVIVKSERATITGMSDESHDLVLRIDRQEKPIEWRSWGRGSKFEVVVEASDKIRLENGKTGHGFVATKKHDATKPGGDTTYVALTEGNPVAGTFVIRQEKDLATKNGVLTFADITLKDGMKLPVSFCLEPTKIGEKAAEKDSSGEQKSKKQPAGRDQEKKGGKNSPAQAAQKAYEAAVAAYETGTADIEAVYRWSCRWMQAERTERGNAAIQSHLDRMQTVYEKIKALHDEGARGGDAASYTSANYYVVEAQEMLQEAKKPAANQKRN